MPTTYTGNPNNDPVTITIPSDNDGPGIKAADVNVPFEALMDKVAALRQRAGVTFQEFLAAGPTVWTPPNAKITYVDLLMAGGGGAGGPGAPGQGATDRWVCGGGAGAGAPLVVARIPVTYGVNYEIYNGIGGAFGSTNSVRNDDGSPSMFKIQGGNILCRAPGGGGGWGAVAAGNFYGNASLLIQTLGGTSEATAYEDLYLGFGNPGEIRAALDGFGLGLGGPQSLYLARRCGDGGFGTVANASVNILGGRFGSRGMRGAISLIQGLTNVATGGAPNADSGSYRSGGGGGGGGNGPWGIGGNGGGGGAGNNAGVGGAGFNGADAADNTSAGGGGGGAGGSGSGGAGANGIGGKGGSGRTQLFYVGAP